MIIDPRNVEVNSEELITIVVKVVNGLDLYAYDILLTYDPAVVSLESWVQGSYLTNLMVVFQESKAGSLRLAATQVGTPGVSGDGTLLTLNFRAENPGFSPVSIAKVQLVNESTEMIIPQTEDGGITVNQLPSATFTVTQTPFPSATRTFTSTSSPTRTKTSIATYTSTATVLPGFSLPSTPIPASGLLPGSQTALSEVFTPSVTPKPTQRVDRATPTNPIVQGSTGEVDVLNTPAQATATGGEGASMARLNSLLWLAAALLIVILAGMTLFYFRTRKKI